MWKELRARTLTRILCQLCVATLSSQQKANAALYTFENSSYVFKQTISGVQYTFDGYISGSFTYSGDPGVGPESFSNVNVTFGAPSPNQANEIGSYWTGADSYLAQNGGNGTPTSDSFGLRFNYGSAMRATTDATSLTSQVLYFWNNAGDGVSLRLNRTLSMTPGDIYNESASNYPAGRYFCNAVLDGSTSLLTGTGIAGSCASNVIGTVNQRLIYSYNISLTAPSPAIGLGLLPLLQTLRSRRRGRGPEHQRVVE